MNNNVPRTPFSTALSGSARETEIRLKNIFSGPKKRPPVLFLVLMFSLCVFCGNLVSCNVAQAEAPDASPAETESPDSSASAVVEPDSSSRVRPIQAGNWLTAELKNTISPDRLLDLPYEICPLCREPLGKHDSETCGHLLVDQIPAEELPREAVNVFDAQRKDYWRDTLLPVAYDPETDFTVYFVVVPDSMPNIGPGASPDLWSLDRAGVVLRLRDHAGYYNWDWGINAKFGSNPLLVVDDFDGDSRPEAALALTCGEGTGCYVESLYIIELDWGAMIWSTLDCSDIPLEIAYDRNRTAARLVSGEKEWNVNLNRLAEPFKGAVEVGNQVCFEKKDGRLVCDLGLDFSCHTLEYLASAHFPVICEDGTYKLGPATWMGDIL